jgi:nitrogenase iron protein NifH
VYRSLARKIAGHTESRTPAPLEVAELREWAASWADNLLVLEQGKITSPGDAI